MIALKTTPLQHYLRSASKSLSILFFSILLGCGSSDKNFVEVIDWGPQETTAGEAFNRQPDGSSAIWFRHSGIADSNQVEVWFGDVNLGAPAIAKDIGSFVVPARLTKQSGSIAVFLIVKSTNARIDLGVFEVR